VHEPKHVTLVGIKRFCLKEYSLTDGPFVTLFTKVACLARVYVFPYTISESQPIVGVSPALQLRSLIMLLLLDVENRNLRHWVVFQWHNIHNKFRTSRSDCSEFEMLETQTTRRNQKPFLLLSEKGM